MEFESRQGVRCLGSGAAVLLVMLSGTVGAVELDCLIEPHMLIEVGSPVAGVLESINVDRGDTVEEGEIIGRLMSDVERASVELARAQAAGQAVLEAGRARVAYEKRREERNERLFETNVISAEIMDQIETELRLRQFEVLEAEENLQVAALEVKRAEALLAIRSIKSPIRGVVTERALSPGEFVNDKAHIVTLAQIDPLNVEVFAPISLYGSIEIGMRAEVLPEPPIGGTYDAEVSVVDQVFDAASGTFGIRLLLDNPNHRLPAGLHCTVRFAID